MQNVVFDFQQFNNAQADCIGTQWCTCCKNTMFHVLQKWFDDQFRFACIVQVVDQIKMGKAFYVF